MAGSNEGTYYLYPQQPYILELNAPNEEVKLTRTGPDAVNISHKDPYTQQWSAPTPLDMSSGLYSGMQQQSANPSTGSAAYSGSQAQDGLYFGPVTPSTYTNPPTQTYQAPAAPQQTYQAPAAPTQTYQAPAAPQQNAGVFVPLQSAGPPASQGGAGASNTGSPALAAVGTQGGQSSSSGKTSESGSKSGGNETSSKSKDASSKDSDSKDGKSKSNSTPKKKNAGAGVCMGTAGVAFVAILCSMLMF